MVVGHRSLVNPSLSHFLSYFLFVGFVFAAAPTCVACVCIRWMFGVVALLIKRGENLFRGVQIVT